MSTVTAGLLRYSFRPRRRHGGHRYRLAREELDMMAAYYRARGWTQDGLVPEAKLGELGLEGMVAEVV